MSSWFDRFSKEWASLGVVQDPSDAQSNSGFAFLGQAPPTVELFNSIMQWNDKKDNWLKSQISNVMTNASITPSETDLLGLLHAIQAMVTGGSLGFVPVQQGGGVGQTTNKIYMGYNGAGGVKVQVDNNTASFGRIAFLEQANTWTGTQTAPNFTASNAISATGAITGGSLTSNSAIVSATAITASTGDITALVGKLRAGAGSGGDPNAAVLLSEFSRSFASNQMLFVFPGNPPMWLQFWWTSLPWDVAVAVNSTVAFPWAFPNYCSFTMVQYAGTFPPPYSQNPGLAAGLSDRFGAVLSVGATGGAFGGLLGVNCISAGW